MQRVDQVLEAVAFQTGLDVGDEFGDKGLNFRDDGVGRVHELGELSVDGLNVALEEGRKGRDLGDQFLQLGDDFFEELDQLGEEASTGRRRPAGARVTGGMGLMRDSGDASATLVNDLFTLGQLGLHALDDFGGVG